MCLQKFKSNFEQPLYQTTNQITNHNTKAINLNVDYNSLILFNLSFASFIMSLAFFDCCFVQILLTLIGHNNKVID